MTLRYEPAIRVESPRDSNTPSGLGIQWLDWLMVTKGRQPRTGEAYSIVLRQWIVWCDGQNIDPLYPELSELEEFVQRPRTRQAHGKMGSASTRRGEIVALRQWFKWLAQRGHVAADPTLELEAPSVKAGLPKPIPDGDWRILLGAQMTPRLRLALGLGYYCGLRRAELSALTGRQITETHIKVFVRKGGGDDTLPWRSMVSVYEEHLPQLIPEPERFVEGLLTHAQDVGGNLMFWTEGQAMYKYMTRVCRKAGLPHYTPHQLRHSCATNLIRASVPMALVASMLNHSSLDITKRYVRAGGDELDEWRRRVTKRE